MQHERCPSVNIYWGCVVVASSHLSAKLNEVCDSSNSDNIKYIEQILTDIFSSEFKAVEDMIRHSLISSTLRVHRENLYSIFVCHRS